MVLSSLFAGVCLVDLALTPLTLPFSRGCRALKNDSQAGSGQATPSTPLAAKGAADGLVEPSLSASWEVRKDPQHRTLVMFLSTTQQSRLMSMVRVVQDGEEEEVPGEGEVVDNGPRELKKEMSYRRQARLQPAVVSM